MIAGPLFTPTQPPATASAGPARRLLVLLPIAPRLDATSGTGRATAQLLANLANRHRVALVYLRAADEPPVDDRLKQQCELVEEVLRPQHSSGLLPRTLHGARLIGLMLRGSPMWVTDWHSPAFAHRVKVLAQTWQPEIVQLEYHVMGQYLPALAHCSARRVLVEHDPGIKAAPYLQHVHHRLGQWLHYPDVLAWHRFERNILQQVDAVVVFTDRDRDVLTPLSGQTPIVQIPIGTAHQAGPLEPLGSFPPSLVFVGNYKHAPNVDAAERLIRVILPQVHRHNPAVKLILVGDQPPLSLQQLAGEKVVITGRVPDVTPYLNQAALVVAPLRLGGGMRVKVLEALAAGKPVIASPLALEGLAVTDGQQVVAAKTDEQFAARIIQLLANPDERKALAERAYAWALAHLGWEKSVQSYEALYQQLIETPQRVER